MFRPVQVFALVFLLGLTALADVGQKKAGVPTIASVCEVIAQPEVFQQKLVLIQAAVLSDGRHGTILVAPECKGGIIMDVSESVRDHNDIKAFTHALLFEGGVYGTNAQKKVSAKFLGVFRYLNKPDSRMVLNVVRITGVQVRK